MEAPLASFDGTGFVGMNEDAVDDNQPLDVFVELAHRNNLIWLDSEGHACTWTPRAEDSAGVFKEVNGQRAYTSVGWSSILHVPWLVQPGLSEIEVDVLGVANAQATSTTLATQAYLELGPLITKPPVPELYTQVDDLKVFRITRPTQIAAQGDVILPLTLWQRGLVGTQDVQRSTIMDNVDMEANAGAVLAGGTSLFEPYTTTRPGGADDHVRCVEFPGFTQRSDILFATQIGGAPYAIVHHNGANTFYVNDNLEAKTYMLGYMQVRSAQVRQRFSRVELRRERYLPQATVEAVDSQRHLVDARTVAGRARPVFIGPVGKTAPPEDGNTPGWGTRFTRVAGNAAFQPFERCPLDLRTDRPDVRLLMHVIPVIRGTGVLGAPTDLEVETNWEIEVEARLPFGGGSLGTATDTFKLKSWATLIHGGFPFFSMERRLELASQNIPFKEGQLFEADLPFVQTLDLTIPGVIYEPSVEVGFPAELITRARLAGLPPVGAPSDAAFVTPVLSSFCLVCVGYTVWEVPNV
jgi:hypothetical protein